MRTQLTILVLAAVLAAPLTFASADNQTLTPEDIRAQQSQLQSDVRAGKGAFKDMSQSDRLELMAKQERVLALLQNKQSLEELSNDDRLAVFNILEDIKSTVSRAEDERKVCKRTKVVGSNLPQVVCMTAAQQREQERRAKELMQRAARCADASCLSSGG